MEKKAFQSEYQFESGEKKNKRIWKNIGIGALAFAIAVITIFVISL